MNKITIQLGQTSLSATHPWAVAMTKIVQTISPKVSKDIQGISGSEGVEIPTALGNKIKAAFKKAGYQPFDQIDDLWVIESLDNAEVGITIDYRKDMDYAEGNCLIMFYDDQSFKLDLGV